MHHPYHHFWTVKNPQEYATGRHNKSFSRKFTEILANMNLISKSVGVFGAANTDLVGFPESGLVFNDSNKGKIKMLPGGVGRNIAENLSRLGQKVSLISVFGNDIFKDFLFKHAGQCGIDMSESLILDKYSSAVFSAVLNRNNDLAVAIADMKIYDQLSPDLFYGDFPSIAHADYVIMETNFPASVLDYLVNRYPYKKWILDTVSGDKAKRCEPVLSHLYILKTNLIEAEVITGIPAKTSDYTPMVEYFLDEGVENVFITLGKEGVIYGNKEKIHYLPPVPSKVINTIGAGDAFLSGVVFGFIQEMDLDSIAKLGLITAGLTVQTEEVVSPNISPELVLSKLSL
jgi:pseudouridine kinase